jgi:MoxR-like ATPase
MTELKDNKAWWIYQGTGLPHDGINHLPEAPPWRRPRHTGLPIENPLRLDGKRDTYQASRKVIELVNTALYLRRPLLVTGKPGMGKSSLANAVAHELGLGEPLYWPISTRTILTDGLYHYDAIGRLQEAARLHSSAMSAGVTKPDAPPITNFLRLGALGTALAPWKHPRVLLIDEIDKGDVDLPNDLLHVLEERQFELPELSRLAQSEGSNGTESYQVRPADSGAPVPIGADGWVRCHAFPFIIMTSNGEREFPPAFLRRCVRLKMDEPDKDTLTDIVRAHLGEEATRKADKVIADFFSRSKDETLATDQLLNAVFLATTGPEKDLDALLKAVLQGLGGSGAV